MSHDFNQMKVVSVTVSHCAVVGAEVCQDRVSDDQGGHGPILPPLGDDLVVAEYRCTVQTRQSVLGSVFATK